MWRVFIIRAWRNVAKDKAPIHGMMPDLSDNGWTKTHFCNYNYLPVIKRGNGKSTIYTQDDLPTNTSIESGFPIATFDYRRVSLNISFSDSAIFNRRIDISAIGAGQLGSSQLKALGNRKSQTGYIEHG